MKKNLLHTIIFAGIMGLLFTGCGRNYQTNITPFGGKDNKAVIVADQDSATSYLFQNAVKRTNFRYALAIAAQLTKDKGYTYFSIISPNNAVDELEDSNSQTMEDAVKKCDESFYMLITEASEGCNSMVAAFTNNMLYRYELMTTIAYHNENRDDGATFNAENILKEAIDYGLNPDYFRKIER